MALFPPVQIGERAFTAYSLTYLVPVLREALGVELVAWAQTQNTRANDVYMIRAYYNGDAPANLTKEMRDLLRMSRPGMEFADNYLPLIVSARTSRLKFEGVNGDSDDATEFMEDVYEKSKQGILTHDVHEAAFRDGDTYVLITYDAVSGLPRFTHQLAFDGYSGMVAVYESADSDKLLAMVKIWHVPSPHSTIEGVRVNIYLPDRVLKFQSLNNTALTPAEENAETDPMRLEAYNGDGAVGGVQMYARPTDAPLGIPVVHFKHRPTHNYGVTELRDVIVHQDALNRTYYSMLIAAELGAFKIRVATGFTPQPEVKPGMWLVISPDGPLQAGETANVSELDASDPSGYIQIAEWIIQQMHRITSTPSPEFGGAGDNASGEALKQREIGLIAQVQVAMARFGEAWEECAEKAACTARMYSPDPPPPCESWNSQWGDPEIRNDAVTVANANAVRTEISAREYLRLVAGVFGWSEEDIERILEEKQAEKVSNFAAMSNALPHMTNFPPLEDGATPPPNGPDNNNGAPPLDNGKMGNMEKEAA